MNYLNKTKFVIKFLVMTQVSLTALHAEAKSEEFFLNNNEQNNNQIYLTCPKPIGFHMPGDIVSMDGRYIGSALVESEQVQKNIYNMPIDSSRYMMNFAFGRHIYYDLSFAVNQNWILHSSRYSFNSYSSSPIIWNESYVFKKDTNSNLYVSSYGPIRSESKNKYKLLCRINETMESYGFLGEVMTFVDGVSNCEKIGNGSFVCNKEDIS